MEFYSVSAQIIVVLLLALTVESKTFGDVKKSDNTLPSAFMRLNQVVVYAWGLVGLAVCMLKLAGFDFWHTEGGKLTVLFVIFIMVSYLGLAIILKNTYEKSKLYITTIVSFFSILLFIPVIINYISAFNSNRLDSLILSITSVIMLLICGIFLLANKKYNLHRLQKFIFENQML